MNAAEKVYNKRYRKIKEIGEGAYGKINLAERLEHSKEADEDFHNKYVALKKLKMDVSNPG